MSAYIVHRDSKSVPTVWQTWHVTTYAVTGVLGFVTSVVFYQGLVQSHYYCYQYNSMIMVHEWSRDKYEPYLLDQTVWYQNSYCYNSFVFPLKTFVSSIVWMIMCLIFGRGGVNTPEFDFTKYFSALVIGQWRIVFWAVLFNLWFMVESLLIAVRFTDGYQKFLNTIIKLPPDDRFRNEFKSDTHPYFVISIILFWCLNVMCTFNFILMVYRCASGIDFTVDHENDTAVDLESAGPSNVDNVEESSSFNKNIILE